MNDAKPEALPAFPMDDKRSVPFHVAMGTIDAAASLVPGASYGMQQLVRRFIGEPLERRREAWFIMIGEGLQELQERLGGFDPAKLQDNPEFISAVAEATQIAMRTHKAEKLDVLKNAVLNTAANITLHDVVRGSFMQMVHLFSSLHYDILRQMQHSPVPLHQRMKPYGRVANEFQGTVDSTVTTMYFDLDQEYDKRIISRVIYDLSSNQFISYNGEKGARHGDQKYTTDLGDDFLRFTSSPL